MEKDCKTRHYRILDTFTVLLVGFILAVCISIASESTINTLPTGTLELGLGAYGTVEFITVIFTFSKTITAPSHRDAVNFPSETSELLRRTCWGLFRGRETHDGHTEYYRGVLQHSSSDSHFNKYIPNITITLIQTNTEELSLLLYVHLPFK